MVMSKDEFRQYVHREIKRLKLENKALVDEAEAMPRYHAPRRHMWAADLYLKANRKDDPVMFARVQRLAMTIHDTFLQNCYRIEAIYQPKISRNLVQMKALQDALKEVAEGKDVTYALLCVER